MFMADELISEGHSLSKQIEARQKKVNAFWAELERSRAKRAAELGTNERIADFDSSYDDTRERMQGKFDLLGRNPNDLKSLQNLTDLKPLEDKNHYLEKVKKKNHEAVQQSRRRLLNFVAFTMICRAHEKIEISEQSQSKEMFEYALRDLLTWIDRKKALFGDV